MLEKAKEILKKIEDNNFRAYVVGGFARDYYLSIDSKDIDICTNATPAQLSNIFDNLMLKNKKYGTVSLEYKGIHFEITTFRKERKYKNARRPLKIKYIQDLRKDLKRRDFTMNTLCIDSKGTVIDHFNASLDIDNKIIRVMGNPNKKFKEDALRMLRAVRFISQLGFDLEGKTLKALKRNRKQIKKLTYQRKKEELNKIFIGKRPEKALNIIKKLKLERYLEIGNIDELILIPDILGLWAQLNIDYSKWLFSKTEKETILKIKELLKQKEIDNYLLYKNGLYINEIACKIKKEDVYQLSKRYTSLPIKSIKDIKISTEEICKTLNKNPGPFIKDIYNDLEKAILEGKLKNTKKTIKEYIINNF